MNAEEDQTQQYQVKQLCQNLGLPLSIYVYNKVLIEAIKIQDGKPKYLVKHLASFSKAKPYLASFEEVQSSFDLSEARIYYGKGKLVNDRVTAKTTSNPLLPGMVLLIPESTTDRIMSFDPISGDLINADFIPGDPTNLRTPITALQHPSVSDQILVSDQLVDAIQLYDNTGNYIQQFFGGNIAIVDNLRGIEVKHSQQSILGTIGGGTNNNAIPEFDLNGNFVGNFIAPGLGGLGSPFDVLFHAATNTYLISGIDSDAIHQYDTNGNFMGLFANINTFPEQLTELADGRVAVTNFSGTSEDIFIYSSTGTLLNQIDVVNETAFRGIYLLGNGNLLATNGTGVYEVDFSGNVISTKIAGVSARFIEEFRPAIDEEIPVLSQWLIISLCLILMIVGLVYHFNFSVKSMIKE